MALYCSKTSTCIIKKNHVNTMVIVIVEIVLICLISITNLLEALQAGYFLTLFFLYHIFILGKPLLSYREQLFFAIALDLCFQNTPRNQQKILIRSSLLVISVLFFVLADLKRICETEYGSLEIKNDKVRQMLGKNGLVTQCIQAKNAILCKDMALAQLCLKINSKMGGANNAIVPNTVTRLVSLPR